MPLNPTPAPSEVPKPKLEDQLRNAIRAKQDQEKMSGIMTSDNLLRVRREPRAPMSVPEGGWCGVWRFRPWSGRSNRDLGRQTATGGVEPGFSRFQKRCLVL